MKWFYRRKNWFYTTDLYVAAAKEAMDQLGPLSHVTRRRIETAIRYYPQLGLGKRFLIDQVIPLMLSFAWSAFVVNATFDQIGWWACLLAIASGLSIVMPYGLFLAPWLKGWA